MAGRESLVNYQDDEAAGEEADAVSVQVSVTTAKRKKKKKTTRDDSTESLAATYSVRTTHAEGCESIPEEADLDGMLKSNAVRDDRLILEMANLKQEMKKLATNQLRMLDLLVGGDRAHANLAAIQDAENYKGSLEGAGESQVAAEDMNEPIKPKKKKSKKNKDMSADEGGPTSSEALSEGDEMRATMSRGKTGRATRLSAIERRTEEASKRELRIALERAEEIASEEEEKATNASKNFFEAIAKIFSSTESLSIAIDSVVGFVIVLNAFWIGISMDLNDADVATFVVSICFSSLFLLELILNFKLYGFWRYEDDIYDGHKIGIGFFNGKTKYWNWFDFFLVGIDLIQLVASLIPSDSEESSGGGGIASAFRLIRLAKLLRLVRLLRAEVFSDLFVMVEGMVGGMTTLVWALVLLLTMLYVLSLANRELYGRSTEGKSHKLYDSVPRSFLTTFQCAFDVGCATAAGLAIPELIIKDHGLQFGIFNLLIAFIITIGVLNVVSAIFVENTLSSAHNIVVDKKKKRLHDKDLWARSVATLVLELLIRVNGLRPMDGRHSGVYTRVLEEDLSSKIDEIASLQVKRRVVEEWVRDDDVRDALVALDISPCCSEFLADILDHDNRDCITMDQILDGIRRLRGDPRRSDIIAVDIMVRRMGSLVAEINRNVAVLVGK